MIDVLGRFCIFITSFLSISAVFYGFYFLVFSDVNFEFGIRGSAWMPSPILTLIYGFLTTILQALIGISLASLVFIRIYRGKSGLVFIITILMLPYAIPPSLTVMIFELMFDTNGFASQFLSSISKSLGTPLLNPFGRFSIMVLASVWQYFSFFFVATLVGFIAVPRNMINQARIDGSTDIFILRKIAIPLALPAIFAACILRLILMIGKVDISLAYYRGSVHGGAETLPVQIVVGLFSSPFLMPGGLILLLSFMLIIPVFVYYKIISTRG